MYNQVTIVLNGLICFPVRICDNLLLVLKMCFQFFFFARKKVQGYYSDRKLLISLLSLFFYLFYLFFLFYRCSRLKMLEQLFSKIRRTSMEKIRIGVLFSILDNKALHDGQFPSNFLKYFRTAILKNTSRQLLLEGFLFYASSRPKVLKKLL